MHNTPSLLLLTLWLGLLSGCDSKAPPVAGGPSSRAANNLAQAKSEQDRFYALGAAAKEEMVAGQTDVAGKHANELLDLLPKYRGDWNYGNAIQDAHLVLGRIAVKEGKIEDAKQHLLAAGHSPGSPQMDSFGPNVSLAKDLLEKGERDVAIEYFQLCRKFWKLDAGRLDAWIGDAKSGKSPDFGANLVY